VYIDHAGNIWAGTNKGLSVFDAKAERFGQPWKNKDSLLFTEYITHLIDYGNDTLAIGTLRGLILLDKKTTGTRFINITNNKGEPLPVTALYTDSKKVLWVGSWGMGFHYLDAGAGKLIQLYSRISPRPPVADIVSGFAETKMNNEQVLWISGANGLMRIPVNNRSGTAPAYAVYQRNADSDNSLPAENGGYLFCDESGTIWMAGGEDGIIRFSPGSPVFSKIPLQLASKSSVIDIQSIRLNKQVYRCIGAWYDTTGLTITDESWQLVKRFSRVPANSKNSSAAAVGGVAVDKHDRLWVATLAGLCVLDNRFNTIKNFDETDTSHNKLTKAKVNTVMVDGDTAWVACYNKGIDLYNMRFEKIRHFELNDGSGLEENLLWRFFLDSRRNVWVCGNNKLMLFDKNQKKFTAFTLVPEGEYLQPNDLAELPGGNLLIASKNGLIIFDVNAHRAEFIRAPMLPREDNIISVSTDHDGNAWYLTEEHLVQYDLNRKRFTLFGAGEGLHPKKGMQVVRTFSPGELIVAQRSEILRLNYRLPEKAVTLPGIIITSLQVNDSSWQLNGPLRTLQLKHDQNKLYLEFAAIAYTRTDQNQYAYQLDGIDKDWMIAQHGFASYANLGPGDYTFRVKASNYAGAWGPEYTINVTLAPPFWRTWWFIALSVLAAGSIFFAVVRYISQRNLRERILLLEKEQAVEKERTRIASDMHDDLGSGLTKIAILSEVAKKQLAEPDKAVRQLENISNSSRELVDNLQDIIWVLNPRNDSLDSLAAYIREYALKFFEPMNLQLQFDYPSVVPSVKLSEEMRRNIFLVMKETFNNIAKHAGSSRIFVKLAVKDNNIELYVRDDGKGFEASRIPAFSNGLSNMRNRMV
ncbi:MAG: triple tyrosine motif-containing protein, partial [Chitinophagaceae bacterium]